MEGTANDATSAQVLADGQALEPVPGHEEPTADANVPTEEIKEEFLPEEDKIQVEDEAVKVERVSEEEGGAGEAGADAERDGAEAEAAQAPSSAPDAAADGAADKAGAGEQKDTDASDAAEDAKKPSEAAASGDAAAVGSTQAAGSQGEAAQGSGAEGAEKEGSPSAEPQQRTITINQEQQLWLANLHHVCGGSMTPNPQLVTAMHPDRLEDEIRALITESIGEETAASFDVAQCASVLRPFVAQLHEVLLEQKAQQEGASNGEAQGEGGTGGEGASGGDAENGKGAQAAAAQVEGGAAAAASRGMPRLPARGGAASGAAGGAQRRAAAGESSGAAADSNSEPWDGIHGPDEPADRRKLRQEIQDVRVLAYRSFLRMGIAPGNPQLRQVLYRLSLTERMAAPYPASRPDADNLAQQEASRLEDESKPFNERLTVAVLGPKGCGKTSLIHKLLDKDPVDPFSGGTKKTKVIEGEVFGIPMRFIDTPGLESGFDAQAHNRSALRGLRNMKNKRNGAPQAYMYVDRMDVARKIEVDLQMARTVAEVLGEDVLYMTTLALTYGASRPPESSQGPQSYEVWSVQRMQKAGIAFAAAVGDRGLKPPTALCENHPNCRRNNTGEPVLPNGIAWRRFLVTNLVAASLMQRAAKLQRNKGNQRGQGMSQQAQLMRMLQGGDRSVPFTYVLQQQNQPKTPQKFLEDERAIMTPGEISELKEQDNEEAREQMRRRREFIKERQAEASNPQPIVATPAPDPPLPPSFAAHAHNYRYRYNESSAGWICRPFVDSNGPDRSDGINGGQSERSFVLRPPGRHIGGTPTRVFLQTVKDKDTMTLVANVEGSTWLGKNLVLTNGLESQSVGNDQLFTLHVEPRIKYVKFRNMKRLKTAAGFVATRLGVNRNPFKGSLAKGVRLEQRVRLGKGAKVVATHVRLHSKATYGGERGSAYGLETTFKPQNDPEGLELMAGYNTMRSSRYATNGRQLAGAVVHGGTLAVQKHMTPETILNSRVQYSSNGQSTLNVRVTSHDMLKLAWAFAMPAVGFVWDKLTRRMQEASDF